ncbi:ATP-binding protein [Phyllobacterium endophyticum]|uniref:histidine kinase n=1 Tax=Phyllobacterium endophyticum TaxID=1149773 RepID=A0A2P7AS62_9HYPH|nr:ATP-binding protein [Phyllobacterium endophyticum]MBB3236790.1 signal transduction histidine kinase [Phyllobacterium endophyticum]PSH57062.1 two-component sensor histidine kinase [Phyllobacterium endophyticum]TYR40343.1 HAMP domain-containing protein [Phyllobacterium endophyticum]
MTAFWRKSLATQFIGLTLAALLASQALTVLISWDEYTKKFDAAVKGEFISRAAAITRLMGTLSPQTREQALRASEGSYLRFWLSESEPANANSWRLRALAHLSRPLDSSVDPSGTLGWAGASHPQLPDTDEVATANANDPWVTPTPYLWMLPQPAKVLRFSGSLGYGFMTQLDDGRWLNAAFYQHDKRSSWTSRSLMSLGLTAFILASIGVFIARRIARPLQSLATSAEALGRGQNLPPLSENGPEEIKRTAQSFNTMQSRLHRFVEDRTEMLAAIGHDLRTPLTSLRLRAEFVNDEEIKRKMLSTIDELQSMTEAAISFARGESVREETRVIDLEALVGSICDDQADLGHPVIHIEGVKMKYFCRPDSLRRAIRNLVENAVRYGGEAKVSLRHAGSTVDIVVEDRGKGIPHDMIEKVFAPFVRLETSRNRQTGGIGLGLSIARAVARQHGGDISLSNGESGMQAVISLPREGILSEVPARKSRLWNVKNVVSVSRTTGAPEPSIPLPEQSN